VNKSLIEIYLFLNTSIYLQMALAADANLAEQM